MSNTINKPGFFAYVLAILVPPLSFLFQGKIVAGIISAVVCFIALPFILIGVGLIPWLFMSMWAAFSLGNKMVDARIQEQANITAKAIVTAQREEKQREAEAA